MIALLLSRSASTADGIRRMLGEASGEPIEVEWTSRLETALGHLANAHVEVVMLDVCGPGDMGAGVLPKLRAHAPRTPVVVLGAEEDETALPEGVQDQVVLSRTPGPALARCLRYAVARQHRQGAAVAPPRSGQVLSIWGGKGGVGTTTVALNVAAALAAGGCRVLAIEFRGYCGSFRHHLGNHHPSGDMGGLLDLDAPRIGEAELVSRLCTLPGGLSMLFAPREAADFREIRPEQAERLIDAAGRLADYVVLDLPAVPLAANGVASRHSLAIAMVCDRDPDSVAAARTNLGLLRSWGQGTAAMGFTVVVHRAPLSLPLPLNEIVSRLEQPIAGVIPPVADACLLAHRAGLPLVIAQPETAAARAFVELAGKLSASNFTSAVTTLRAANVHCY
jgi:pilus assembly protein CpaE